jgi:hypothetical protein
MFKRISAKIDWVTVRRAEELMRINTFPGQRAISPWHVQSYIQQIGDGTFRLGHIAVARFRGKEYLMNGQHQCQAVVQSGMKIQATYEFYECEATDDLWKLFATFDCIRTRTDRQIMAAARPLFRIEPLRDVPFKLLGAAGTALLYLGSGTRPSFGVRAMSKAQKGALIEQYADDVLWLAGFNHEARRLITVAVAMAMIVTHRVSGDKADPFWERVLIGDDLRKETPQWSLHRALTGNITAKAGQGVGGAGGNQRIRMIYGLCIAWWNSFATGEKRVMAKPTLLGKNPPDAVTAV